MDLPVSPGGNGAPAQVSGQHLGRGAALVQALLEPLKSLTELGLTDTERASGAQGPVPEEQQRAQGDLRQAEGKSVKSGPAGQTAGKRTGGDITICRLIHDMLAGSGLSDLQLH